MRVILDIPEKYLKFAVGILTEAADSKEQEAAIEQAAERCKDSDTEISIADMGTSKGDIMRFNISMATIALTKKLKEK